MVLITRQKLLLHARLHSVILQLYRNFKRAARSDENVEQRKTAYVKIQANKSRSVNTLLHTIAITIKQILNTHYVTSQVPKSCRKRFFSFLSFLLIERPISVLSSDNRKNRENRRRCSVHVVAFEEENHTCVLNLVSN